MQKDINSCTEPGDATSYLMRSRFCSMKFLANLLLAYVSSFTNTFFHTDPLVVVYHIPVSTCHASLQFLDLIQSDTVFVLSSSSLNTMF